MSWEKQWNRFGKKSESCRKYKSHWGFPPLFIAADQEGGIVSRLSPPLSKLPPISKLLKKTVPSELDKKIIQYASVHAEELSDLGVNMNLGPVVDLKIKWDSVFPDIHTQIHKRAISDDKSVVADVALLYSKTLEQYGVIPTLKHFPGLGRVRQDTHYSAGKLDLDLRHLEENDWIPFQKIVRQTGACIMMGHVMLKHADPHHPVSFSKTVVQGIIRRKWKYDGILITDDMNMGPVYGSSHGIGGAAVKALNAGIDLLLISYDGAQYYEAMYDVINACNQKMLNFEIIDESNRRLKLAKLKM
ncbi:MAG: glycoside hydrolase family 3 protein [Desulfobacteraceae bacterium]|nr:glycoside hydrolase family 3 protein [Desulfobacteraceae bacterium]